MAKDNLPIGTIMAYAGQTVSLSNNNWKICDGDTIYKSEYPILWNVLGDRWGSYKILGGGEIEFTLPDLRGVFLRGVNAERKDEFKDPDVETRKAVSDTRKNEAGSFQLDEINNHAHTTSLYGSTGGGNNFADPIKIASTDNVLRFTDAKTVNSFGGKETRPKNAYVHYIIKVKDE